MTLAERTEAMKKTNPTAPPARVAPAPGKLSRADGDATRRRLLDIAGEEFADQGYSGTTSKAICARAGVPVASVNYHFGSRDDLYAAVLIEAHNQVFSLEAMQDVITRLATPAERLQAALRLFIEAVSKPERPWSYRVVAREILSPTLSLPVLVEKGIQPKAALMLLVVAEYLGLPPTHPAVQRSLLFAILPCMAMLLAPRELPTRVLPIAFQPNPQPLAEDFLTHTMAGLKAMAAGYVGE